MAFTYTVAACETVVGDILQAVTGELDVVKAVLNLGTQVRIITNGGAFFAVGPLDPLVVVHP